MRVVDVEIPRATLDNEPRFVRWDDWAGSVELLDVECACLRAYRGARNLMIGMTGKWMLDEVWNGLESIK